MRTSEDATLTGDLLRDRIPKWNSGWRPPLVSCRKCVG